MPRKEFESFTRLDASDVNTYLMDQSVMTFGGTAARGSAITTPVEGMYSHLNDTDALQYYNGSAWVNRVSVLQVLSTTKTDSFTTSSTSYTEITGLTATITPSSTSSKIMVFYSVTLGQIPTSFPYIRLDRAGTAINIGDAAGSRERVSLMSWTGGASNQATTPAGMFLDSPNRTSATEYKLLIKSGGVGEIQYVNRNARDDNATYDFRGVSSITLMEVAG
jgi:hypothetical protein